MIKLVNILKEVFEPEMYSWQKPDGTFLPVNDSNHDVDAIKHTKISDKWKAVDALWKLGWQRINTSNEFIYSNNSYMGPNLKQKSQLIELALRKNVASIVWDNTIRDRIIWTRNDVLEESHSN